MNPLFNKQIFEGKMAEKIKKEKEERDKNSLIYCMHCLWGSHHL
jgi:hypothetical protein